MAVSAGCICWAVSASFAGCICSALNVIFCSLYLLGSEREWLCSAPGPGTEHENEYEYEYYADEYR